MKQAIFTIVASVFCGLLIGFGSVRFIGQRLSTGDLSGAMPGGHRPVVLGFFPYWLLAQQRETYQDYLTDVTYFSLTIQADGSIQKLVNTREEEPGWTRLRGEAVKNMLSSAARNTQKTSLLVHNSSPTQIAQLIASPSAHAQRLVSEVEPLMKTYGFTDLNLDIESFQEASSEAQLAYTAFVKEVKTQMDQKALGTLTVEVTPISLVSSHLTDAQAIGEVADYVVLMAYDFHYRGSTIAGPVAPVGGAGEMREYDVETSVRLIAQVVPKEKILLGIPLYGYEWETIERYPQAPTIPGSGKTASHRRVSELLAECVHCIKALDVVSQQPYLILPATEEGYSQQIFYEDKESLERKLELAQKYQLGGVALWAMGYEGTEILVPLREYKQTLIR